MFLPVSRQRIVIYPRVGADAAVERGIVAGDGEGVDERLCEAGRLLEVVVDVLGGLELQPCGRKGEGTGSGMIRVLSGIMKGYP